MSKRRDSRDETSTPEEAEATGGPEEGKPEDGEPEEEPRPDERAADRSRAAGEPEPAGPDDEEEPTDSEVARLRTELGDLNERHLRLAAEFDNFRKRSHNQMGESTIRAQAALVGKLLDVLDDFDRISSIEPEQATIDSVLEGVQMVERKLHRSLEEAGMEPIDPDGETFDPNSMEAIMREPAESEDEDDTVSRVMQRGFRFRGHLVRPARVAVRKYDA